MDGAHRVAADSQDPLWRMRAYRLAWELANEAWDDAEKLRHHSATEKISGQLYAAVGSIGANLAEGYSHASVLARSSEQLLRSSQPLALRPSPALPLRSLATTIVVRAQPSFVAI